MNATYPTVEEQMKLEQAIGIVPIVSSAGLDGEKKTVQTESAKWLKEADKIIAAYPEKHRDYHAMVLRHAYERGLFETNCAIKSLMAIKELIIKGEYSDERVLELINEGLQ